MEGPTEAFHCASARTASSAACCFAPAALASRRAALANKSLLKGTNASRSSSPLRSISASAYAPEAKQGAHRLSKVHVTCQCLQEAEHNCEAQSCSASIEIRHQGGHRKFRSAKRCRWHYTWPGKFGAACTW